MTGLRLAQDAVAGVLALTTLSAFLVAIAIWRGQWWLWTLAMLAGAAALVAAVTLGGGTRTSTAPAGPAPGTVARGAVSLIRAPNPAAARSRARPPWAFGPEDPSRIGYDGSGPRPDAPEPQHTTNRGS